MADQPVQTIQVASWIIPFVSALVSVLFGAFAGWLTVVFKMGKYQEKVDHLVSEKGKMLVKLESIKSDVDRLGEFKINTQKFIDSKIYQAQSKLQLTQVGKDLVNNSGFATIFETQKNVLADLLNQQAPATQYDVQEKSRALLDDMTNDPIFSSIKTYAFQSGKDIGQILRAGGILLRDYYLEIHPEITK